MLPPDDLQPERIRPLSRREYDQLVELEVPEYWIFDLRAKAIDVHTQPVDGRYTSVVRLTGSGVLKPVALPGISIDVAQIRWD